MYPVLFLQANYVIHNLLFFWSQILWKLISGDHFHLTCTCLQVDKLKDLCLKQREEIKALKSAILFPDVMSTQLQGLLNQQDSELKHAKQIIPTLQRQVTSLTGQLQCLAEDLAEVTLPNLILLF